MWMTQIRHYWDLAHTLLRFGFQGLRYYLRPLLWGNKKVPIHYFERRVYSQNGEDGILGYIFHRIRTTNKVFVEIGAGDGLQCNTRFLRVRGWQGIQIDAVGSALVKHHFADRENIEKILKNYNISKAFDLLSIDIDGNDYWIWQAITHYRPRVVVIEYNAMMGSSSSVVMPYDSRHIWDGTEYFGASLAALVGLGRMKGYRLIGTDSQGVNAFFVESKLAKLFATKTIEGLFHPPKYELYPPSKRKMITV